MIHFEALQLDHVSSFRSGLQTAYCKSFELDEDSAHLSLIIWFRLGLWSMYCKSFDLDWNCSGFWHGRTGWPPGGGIFSWYMVGGKSSLNNFFFLILCTATMKWFSIIYHFTVWGIGKLMLLLAEKVPWTEAVWEGERGNYYVIHFMKEGLMLIGGYNS